MKSRGVTQNRFLVDPHDGPTLLALVSEPIVTARVVVVVAHPDDETIGAGALLARTVDAHVIVVTDGAPLDSSMWPRELAAGTREEYGQIRREELQLAMAEAGIGRERVHLLGVPDGEAAEHIGPITRQLVRLFDRLTPGLVITHAYEGSHIDHDSTALAVHLAMAEGRRGRPLEAALYHGAGVSIAVHEFLPGGPPDCVLVLKGRPQDIKKRMLARYVSQRQYDAYFGTELERYRHAPAYDFGVSPMPAKPLLYERMNGSYSGERWREGARVLAQKLHGTPELPFDAVPAATPEAPHPRKQLAQHPVEDDPLVSVIVRTLGRETLPEALDSIAAQTHRRIEVVLVDVGGEGVASDWQGRQGLSVRRCPAAGQSRPEAGNTGLRAATGEFVAFLDDDDWFHPQHVASLITALQQKPEAGLAYEGVEVIEWLPGAAPRRALVYDMPFDPVALLCQNYIPINAFLVRRDLFVVNGCTFDVSLAVYEDWDLLIQLSRHTDFIHLPSLGAVYRWPPGSPISDREQIGAAQARIFDKWRGILSRDEHGELMRRAAAQIEIDHERATHLQDLQRHLASQDAELERLRPCVAAQERQLDELRTHLKTVDDEVRTLRDRLAAREAELIDLRVLLPAAEVQSKAHVTELAALRSRLRANEELLQAVLMSWSWKLTSPLRSIANLVRARRRGR
jgi:LmbE family N-acetylglucosaminyl deacetylase/uncharacterized coiled-coil protein SlyX